MAALAVADQGCGVCGAGGKRHGPVLVQLRVEGTIDLEEAGLGGEVTMETCKALWAGPTCPGKGKVFRKKRRFN